MYNYALVCMHTAQAPGNIYKNYISQFNKTIRAIIDVENNIMKVSLQVNEMRVLLELVYMPKFIEQTKILHMRENNIKINQ